MDTLDDHLTIVQYLHEVVSASCTTAAMAKAASSGHIGVVKFLRTSRSEGCTTAGMDWNVAWEAFFDDYFDHMSFGLRRASRRYSCQEDYSHAKETNCDQGLEALINSDCCCTVLTDSSFARKASCCGSDSRTIAPR